MRYFYMAVLSLAFLSCTQPSAAQKKLVIIGSSTSACWDVTRSTCYVGMIEAYYNQQAPFDTVINNDLAVGGYTCYKGMPSSYVSPYSDPAYQPDPGHNISAAIAAHPDVIIVNYPSNGFDVLPVDSILYCFRTIRDSANKAGIPCFVTTSQPRTSPASFNTSPIKLKMAIIKDSILAEFGSFALDFYTGMIDPSDSSILPAYRGTADGVNPDFIHYNEAGHTVLAQRVEAANIFAASLLPATFLKYNATYSNNNTLVTWSTAKEVQVSEYEIDRSADGSVFTSLGDVNPNNGSGVYSYQFTDNHPPKGWSYYKIVIIDQDGKKQYSPVFKAFDNPGGLAVTKVISQPAQVILELQNSTAQNAGLQVLSSTGMLVQKASKYIDAGSSNLTINTLSLGAGIYYIRLTTATGQSVITSFIKN